MNTEEGTTVDRRMSLCWAGSWLMRMLATGMCARMSLPLRSTSALALLASTSIEAKATSNFSLENLHSWPSGERHARTRTRCSMGSGLLFACAAWKRRCYSEGGVQSFHGQLCA